MALRLVADTTTPREVPDTPEVRKIAHILREKFPRDKNRIVRIHRARTYRSAGMGDGRGRRAFDALLDAEVLIPQSSGRGGRMGTYYLTDRLWSVPEISDLERGEIVRWHLRSATTQQREEDFADPVFGEERKRWVLEAWLLGRLQPVEGTAVPW